MFRLDVVQATGVASSLWLPLWTAGVSDRSLAGLSCGGCVCGTSWSLLAHHEVEPGESKGRRQCEQVKAMNLIASQ